MRRNKMNQMERGIKHLEKWFFFAPIAIIGIVVIHRPTIGQVGRLTSRPLGTRQNSQGRVNLWPIPAPSTICPLTVLNDFQSWVSCSPQTSNNVPFFIVIQWWVFQEFSTVWLRPLRTNFFYTSGDISLITQIYSLLQNSHVLYEISFCAKSVFSEP